MNNELSVLTLRQIARNSDDYLWFRDFAWNHPDIEYSVKQTMNDYSPEWGTRVNAARELREQEILAVWKEGHQ